MVLVEARDRQSGGAEVKRTASFNDTPAAVSIEQGVGDETVHTYLRVREEGSPQRP